jgi:hypothetical protein
MFKRNLALCLAALFCMTCMVYAAVRWVRKGDPHIVSDAVVYDFGAMPTGRSVEYVFTLSNRGASPLEIVHVRTGCSCTTAEISDKILMPGGTATVAAKLSLNNLRGPVEQDIVVECNDPKRRFFLLKLKGVAESAFTIHPAAINFGNVAEGETPEHSVDLDANGNVPFKLLSVSCDSPRFVLTQQTLVEGRSYRVRVRMVKDVPKGPWQTKLRIKTDNTTEAEMVVPMMARVSPKT